MTVGYAGGKLEWPTYKSIKDHTEAVRVEYDPKVLTYEDILTVYFDEMGGPPTFPSFSRQYRNALLVHNEDQRRQADDLIEKFTQKLRWQKIYVDVEDSTPFYRAEEYHQKYLAKQRNYRF